MLTYALVKLVKISTLSYTEWQENTIVHGSLKILFSGTKLCDNPVCQDQTASLGPIGKEYTTFPPFCGKRRLKGILNWFIPSLAVWMACRDAEWSQGSTLGLSQFSWAVLLSWVKLSYDSAWESVHKWLQGSWLPCWPQPASGRVWQCEWNYPHLQGMRRPL